MSLSVNLVCNWRAADRAANNGVQLLRKCHSRRSHPRIRATLCLVLIGLVAGCSLDHDIDCYVGFQKPNCLPGQAGYQGPPARPSTPRLDEIKMQEIIAKYMVKPLHKALFMNLVDFTASGVANEPELQAAIDKSDQECRDHASSQGVDPKRCTPIYVDEQQMLDWKSYTVPR
jgi:hypothetical protein